MEEGAQFCASCGTPIEGVAATVAAEESTPASRLTPKDVAGLSRIVNRALEYNNIPRKERDVVEKAILQAVGNGEITVEKIVNAAVTAVEGKNWLAKMAKSGMTARIATELRKALFRAIEKGTLPNSMSVS
ncbi:hypothetical protein AGMMS49944_10610 [Spirochaetia bacterium]|nr:hypothetical protein AGMMS49944_10610 [Spirochaetia bacterium]